MNLIQLIVIILCILIFLLGYILFNISKNNTKVKTGKKRDYKIFAGYEITEKMLKEIAVLDKNFFKDEYLWDDNYQLQVFNKNKNSMIIVMYKDRVVGYLNYLVIVKEKYEKIINSNITVDEFDLEEVTTFQQNENNYLTINSVVVDKNFQDGYTVKLLTKRLKKILKYMHHNNYKIAGINAIAVSNDGRKFLEYLGFKKYKELDDNNFVYVLNAEQLDKYLK